MFWWMNITFSGNNKASFFFVPGLTYGQNTASSIIQHSDWTYTHTLKSSNQNTVSSIIQHSDWNFF